MLDLGNHLKVEKVCIVSSSLFCVYNESHKAELYCNSSFLTWVCTSNTNLVLCPGSDAVPLTSVIPSGMAMAQQWYSF